MTKETSQLVKVEQLFADKQGAVAQNELNILLNNEPKPEWFKEHPYIKGYKYIPIARVEWLLTSIFQKWRVEVKDVKHIANSVVVTVRLHVWNPMTKEWDYQDGVGASPLQVDKEASAIDWSKIKSGAVQMAAPSAESYAFKDAAEKFGKLFGKDLNRKDMISYEILKDKDFSDIEDYKRELSNIKTLDDLIEYRQANQGRGKDFDAMVAERYQELSANQSE